MLLIMCDCVRVCGVYKQEHDIAVDIDVSVAPQVSNDVYSQKEGDGVLVSVEIESVTMRTSSLCEQPVSTDRPHVCAQHYTTAEDNNCLLHAISICLWGVEDTNTIPGAHAQSSAQSPTQSEASLIRQGLKQFMMFNRDLLFLHYKAAERRFNATLLGGTFDLLQSYAGCCSFMLLYPWIRRLSTFLAVLIIIFECFQHLC
jgi:hypothetical protein